MMNHHGLNDKMEDLNHQMVLAAATAAANGPSNYGLQLFYTHLTFQSEDLNTKHVQNWISPNSFVVEWFGIQMTTKC